MIPKLEGDEKFFDFWNLLCGNAGAVVISIDKPGKIIVVDCCRALIDQMFFFHDFCRRHGRLHTRHGRNHTR